MGDWAGVELENLVLTGERLTLRPWRAGDAAEVELIMREDAMHEFLVLPRPYTAADAEAFVGRLGDEGRAEGTGVGCAVVENATGRLVGSAALRLPRERERHAEIGYWVARAAQGNGYAAEASRVLAGWAFEHGVGRVEIRCAVGNVASAKSALAAGFRYEGVLRGRTPTPSGPADEAMFGRLAADPGTPVRPVLPALPRGGLTDGVVLLRVVRAEDAEAMFAELTNPEALRWAFTDERPARMGVAEVAARAALDWIVSPMGRMSVLDASSGEVAGILTLRSMGPPGVGGVGYGIRPEFRGRGFTARALRLLTDWAFAQAGFVRLELGAKTANVASQKAAVSGGFEPDGIREARLRNPDGTVSNEVRFVRINPRYRDSGC